MVGHIAPEAFSGGPLALVVDGDVVTISAARRTLELSNVTAAELAARRAAWSLPADVRARHAQLPAVLRKYKRLVSDASSGCSTCDDAQ